MLTGSPGTDPLTANSPFRARRGIALLLGCAGLLAPGLSAATEWYAQPSVSLQLQHDSNLLLVQGPHPGITGLTLAPRIDLGAQQQNWNVSGSAELRGHRYWGQKGLSSNDQVYGLSSLYQTARTTWQLGGSYAKEAVTPTTTFSPDIGLVPVEVQRITRTASPSWLWQITQRTRLNLNFQSSQVSYDNVPNSGLVDYASRDGSATLLFQWSPQDQLTAQVDREYFKVPQLAQSQLGQPAIWTSSSGPQPNPQTIQNISTTDDLVLGWSHSFSQTLSANFGIGAHRTNSDSVVQTCVASTAPTVFIGPGIGVGTCTQTASTSLSQNSSGYIYNAGLDKQFELTHVTLSLGRQITPSGIGAQVMEDSEILTANHTLSARLKSTVSLAGYQLRAVSATTTSLNNWNYTDASANLAWRWTRRLTLEGGYQYLAEALQNSSFKTNNNSVYLKLTYAWRRFSIYR